MLGLVDIVQIGTEDLWDAIQRSASLPSTEEVRYKETHVGWVDGGHIPGQSSLVFVIQFPGS